MEKTIFEKIVLGEIPCHKVFEDEKTFAFLDVNPKAPGHTLVVPKKAYSDLFELPEDICTGLFSAVKKLALVLRKVTGCGGVKVVMNNGAAAGQEVFHAHVHIIPYFDNNGSKKSKFYKYENGEAERLVEQIQKNLAS